MFDAVSVWKRGKRLRNHSVVCLVRGLGVHACCDGKFSLQGEWNWGMSVTLCFLSFKNKCFKKYVIENLKCLYRHVQYHIVSVAVFDVVLTWTKPVLFILSVLIPKNTRAHTPHPPVWLMLCFWAGASWVGCLVWYLHCCLLMNLHGSYKQNKVCCFVLFVASLCLNITSESQS